jgi:hypothetical protein
MLLCRAGTSASKAKECQPIVDHDDLPWPLSVPWSGSFLTSSNPSRDFPAHGIFGQIEELVVSEYRAELIEGFEKIGDLRNQIVAVLSCYLDPGSKFEFADGIKTPSYSLEKPMDLDSMLLEGRLKTSYENYNSQMLEIMKFCGKQSVMLAHPFGDKDSAVVRKAFEDFITVSSLSDCRRWLTFFIIGSRK